MAIVTSRPGMGVLRDAKVDEDDVVREKTPKCEV